ncbi:arginyl-tRNA synthetase [Kosmotoga arenicorallina S304]|uniref:Arginine--tRNA ligase n=1 Tax=Kosmotoga arenicorallina S304 TaxID=1453497 RepID=A0A182C771_9BACT|nr:arginine--tRNA ligase [Kosmotoga arenicorallina]OAA31351.1 arginyl-tRNA synthetase [Kosmotoga arenicorallina S304]
MFREFVENSIIESLKRLGIENIPSFKIEIPDEKFGDYATNIAFMLTKEIKRPPREIASELSLELEKESYIRSATVAGPGFVNISLTEDAYLQALKDLLEMRYFWKTSPKTSVQFEFGSANPTGPFTIGHGRQLVFGDVLCRIFSARGYRVQREMYINDAGRQIRLLGHSLWVRYNQLFGKEISLPEDGYQGEYLVDMAKEVQKEYGDKFLGLWDANVQEFFSNFALNKMLQSMKETLDKLGVNFDNYFSEKSLVDDGTVDTILDNFREKGLLYEKDGALWFRVSNFVDDNDKVVLRSDGTHTYFLTDIAYHFNKHKRGYDRVYDIWGSDHMGHIPRMKAALMALGISEDFLEVIIHQYVNIKKGDEIVKMSTRKGTFSTLDELVEAAGVDATRYFFAMFDPDTHMLFDLDLAKKKSNENPVFYVQYAHARISSIFRTAKERNFDAGELPGEYHFEPEEKKLIKTVLEFPFVLDSITEDYKVNRLTNYLESLASTFHVFYNKHLVVDSQNPHRSTLRLKLCEITKNAIADGLQLLGVSAPESM